MTEPTQADRDAAAQAFFCKPLLDAKHNDDRRVRSFQRHRIASTAALQARVEELEGALRNLLAACDEGKLVPVGGPCGMTIEAQIRASVYNRVPAWPVEEARAALGGNHDD